MRAVQSPFCLPAGIPLPSRERDAITHSLFPLSHIPRCGGETGAFPTMQSHGEDLPGSAPRGSRGLDKFPAPPEPTFGQTLFWVYQ